MSRATSASKQSVSKTLLKKAEPATNSRTRVKTSAKTTAKTTAAVIAKPQADAKLVSKTPPQRKRTPNIPDTHNLANATMPQVGTEAITGAITGLYDGVLQGWVYDASRPDLSLVIEVCFDGVFGQLARADEFVMHAPEAAQMHGFRVDLRSSWLADSSRVSVRVANQGPWLSGSVDLAALKTQEQSDILAAEGASRVYYAGGLKLVGWALKDKGGSGACGAVGTSGASVVSNNNAQEISVVDGETLVAKVYANQYVAFLSNRSQQGHGFEVDLPWSMADGKRHRLEVLNQDGQAIKGSPLEICVSKTSQASIVRDAWLLSSVQSRQDQSEPPAGLLRVIETHERVYPANFGFVHYPFWYELYQQPEAMKLTAARVAVLVIATDTEAEQAENSIASVFEQRLPADQLECLQVTPAGILKGLLQAAACADVVVPLWAGDTLSIQSVDRMVNALNTQVDKLSSGVKKRGSATSAEASAKVDGWGYCDCDTVIVSAGRDDKHTDPWLKPDWDETLFYGLDYVSRGVFLSADIVKDVLTNQEAQIAALIERTEPDSVWHAFLACVVQKHAGVQSPTTPIHLSEVLYHRGAEKVGPDQATERSMLSRQVSLSWLADSRCSGAQILPVVAASGPNIKSQITVGWRVQWPMFKAPPLVSIVVPTRNGYELLKTVIDGLLENTDYPAFEIIVVDNDSDCPDTLSYLESLLSLPDLRVLRYPHPFNYAAINNFAAEQANGELLLLLNNDVEITDARWLSEMVVQFQRPGVGLVGKKLLWTNGMVQHGGVVVGINGLAAHSHTHCQDNDPGYMGLNRFDREQSAVTAACLMVRRKDYWAVGGLDAHHLPVAFNDVDLCLKLREIGHKIVLTTRFPLIHHESATRGQEDTPQKLARARRERDYFISRWMPLDRVWTDPYYHRGLNHDFVAGPYGGLGRLRAN